MHPEAHSGTETAARENLSSVLTPEVAPGELDLDADLVDSYGLTSLNKVLFLTSVCDDTEVELSNFTEHDLADMRTLRDVVEALSRHTTKVA
jgi:acyl carrier protein